MARAMTVAAVLQGMIGLLSSFSSMAGGPSRQADLPSFY